MKSLLRLVIFIMSLLFLPDPLFAFSEDSQISTGEIWVIDTHKEYIQQERHTKPAMIVAQATNELSRQKQLDAQRSKKGLRVKKKKDFFKSKSPLPAVQMPTDWDGKVSSPPIPDKKTNLRRVKKTKSGAIYESQTYRKAPLPKKTIKKNGVISGLGKPDFRPKLDNSPQIVRLPLPLLKPKGFDRKKHAHYQKLKSQREREASQQQKLAEQGQNDKETTNKAEKRKVQKSAFVVPPPVTFWEPKEIKDAQLICQVLMKDIDASVTPIKPIRRGACGTPAPLKVRAVGEHQGPHSLKVTPPATLNCQTTARFAKWVKKKLQPLAIKHLNSPVSMVHNVASYSCRHRYNDKTRKLSEHALANALDIAGFTLKDGRTVSVLKHWDEEGDLGAFLKTVHAAACEDFVVVLGPEANEAHKNHFHFDLGRYKVCE